MQHLPDEEDSGKYRWIVKSDDIVRRTATYMPELRGNGLFLYLAEFNGISGRYKPRVRGRSMDLGITNAVRYITALEKRVKSLEDSIVRQSAVTQPISTPSSLPLYGEDRYALVSPERLRQPSAKSTMDELSVSITEPGMGDDTANFMGSMVIHQSDKGEFFGDRANIDLLMLISKVHLPTLTLSDEYYHLCFLMLCSLSSVKMKQIQMVQNHQVSTSSLIFKSMNLPCPLRPE